MIEKGNLIVDGYVEEVMRKARQRTLLEIRVKNDTQRAAGLLEAHELVRSVADSQGTLMVVLNEGVLDYSDLPTLLIESGFKLMLFREEDVNLETAFMELTKGLVQ